MGETSKFWQKVPTARLEIFHHMWLECMSMKGVPETTIVKVHNRKVPVKLGMLYRKMTEVWHVYIVQAAVYNYTVEEPALSGKWVTGHTEFCQHMQAGRNRLETDRSPKQERLRWMKVVLPTCLLLPGVGQHMAAKGALGAKQQKGKGYKGQKGSGRGQGGADLLEGSWWREATAAASRLNGDWLGSPLGSMACRTASAKMVQANACGCQPDPWQNTARMGTQICPFWQLLCTR